MIILAVKANKKFFRTVYFQPGFNVVLADRTKESTKKDSRNGLGKSSLIQIIHFCLGGNLSKTLSNKELENWIFTLDVKIAEKKYSISRNISEKNKIFIDGDFSGWFIKPEKDNKTNKYIMTNKDWIKILGWLVLGMEPSYSDFKYIPTFRSCISYFARQNGERGGFLSPFRQYSNQKEWDIQINNSYLLGLDWTYASEWQILKDRKKVLSQIKNEAESGILKDKEGSIGELEAKKIRLEAEINKQKRELKHFQVHPQYNKIETEANQITNEIHDLANNNVSDKNLLEYYEESIIEEKDADVNLIEKMYEEARVVIPNNIKKRLRDVKEFHEKIVENRKEFLTSEIKKLKQRISERDEAKIKLDQERAEIFSILKTHKALEEHNKLQQHNLTLVFEVKDIINRIENLKKFEKGQSILKIDLELIQQKTRISLSERDEIRKKAIYFFNSNSQDLYESPGNLSIDITRNGYKFNVDIEREGSHGINNMKIFCYDLMLAQIWSSENKSPNFLIHDSLLFADVDERQVALALELVARESEDKDKGFQYICTMNSDSIPHKDFKKDFNLQKFVRITLTDATKEGGLFGIRF